MMIKFSTGVVSMRTTTADWGVNWRELAAQLGYAFFPDFVREFGALTHLEKYELVMMGLRLHTF